MNREQMIAYLVLLGYTPNRHDRMDGSHIVGLLDEHRRVFTWWRAGRGDWRCELMFGIGPATWDQVPAHCIESVFYFTSRNYV